MGDLIEFPQDANSSKLIAGPEDDKVISLAAHLPAPAGLRVLQTKESGDGNTFMLELIPADVQKVLKTPAGLGVLTQRYLALCDETRRTPSPQTLKFWRSCARALRRVTLPDSQRANPQVIFEFILNAAQRS